MKKIILLVLTVFAFSFFANAQSLDKVLEQLESVRAQKGEQSKEYLSALDSVIFIANITGEKATAFTYRQQHLDIERQMRGERSVEVADDLWRLGNVSRMLGDTIRAHDYYVQAAGVFEENYGSRIDSAYASHYCSCLFAIIERCAALSEIDNITFYSPRLEKVISQVYETNNCLFSYAMIQLAFFNAFARNVDNLTKYCSMIADKCKAIDSCNFTYVAEAYKWLRTNCHNNNQMDIEVRYALDYVDKLDAAEGIIWQGAFLDEKIDALIQALGALTSLGDMNKMNEGFVYGKRAEKLLLDSRGSEENLYTDPLYYRIYFALAWNRYKVNDFDHAKKYLQMCRDILTQNSQQYSKEYYLMVSMLFKCAMESGEMYLAESLASEMEPLIFSFSDTPLEDAYDFSLSMYGVSFRLGKYKEAMRFCEEEYELGKQLSSNSNLWLVEVNKTYEKAQLYDKTGNVREALNNISEGKRILSTVSVNMDSNILKSMLLSLESTLVTDFEDALVKNDSALFIMDKILVDLNEGNPNNSVVTKFGSNTSDLKLLRSLQEHYCIALSNRSLLFFYHGAIEEASSTMQDCLALIEKVNSKTSSIYISCKNNLALFQLSLGHYSDAIKSLNELLPIIETTIGKSTPSYALILAEYAEYYSRIGDKDKALEHFEQSAAVLKEIGDMDDYPKALANIGVSYLACEDFLRAKEYLEQALDIIKLSENFDNTLNTIYQSLCVVSFELGDLEQSKAYYGKAEHLINSKNGKNSIEYARLLLLKGAILSQKGDEQSLDAYFDAEKTLCSLGMMNNQLYLIALKEYGKTGVVFNKHLIENYSQLLVEAFERFYSDEIMYLSSSDRASMWNSCSDIKDVLFSVDNGKNDVFPFDFVLFSKSLLLTTSDSFKKAVYQTKDDGLIKQYERVLSIQKAIDNQSFINLRDGFSVEEMRDNLVRLERDLIGKMKDSGAYTIENEITYYDVAKSLKPNEIAIEFVDYYHIKDKKTYYVALLAKSNWDKPVYVQLCTEDELKACLGNPNVTYSTDDLYRLLWHPLLEYVGDSCTVYFSPSGMLHTIALESIHTPDGSCLSDKYNLVRLTSTRELCKAKQPKTYETGAIYGGLQYDVEQQRMAEVAAMNKTELEESPAFALRGEDRGNWNYLPGTKDEAEHIAGIMRQANIGCGLYESDLGSEESFKALSGGKTDIIHLATHGYFLEGEKADMNDFMKSLSPLARQKTDSVIDPLLRSGLILSGGNSAWLGKEVPQGIEDGVLTALEISTMNLSGTDMVVMSACETGLGDITSDGVFGLQRAFKMAGVQTLVMSLWKVDDNATSLMMQTFYEHLLSGMSKREAFNLAQAAVRAKYPEPYYWAGFVMLD